MTLSKHSTFNCFVSIQLDFVKTAFAYSLAGNSQPIRSPTIWKNTVKHTTQTSILLRKIGSGNTPTDYECVSYGCDAQQQYFKKKKTDTSYHYLHRFMAGINHQIPSATSTSVTKCDLFCNTHTNAQIPARIVLFHALQYLKSKLIGNICAEVSVEQNSIQWFFVLPTNCKPILTNLFQSTIESSEFGSFNKQNQLQFIKEENCLASMCIYELKNSISPSTKYIIIDIESCKTSISGFQLQSNFVIQQLCPTSVIECGFESIVDECVNILTRLFGETHINTYQAKKYKGYLQIVDLFRNAILNYNVLEDEDLVVTLPLGFIKVMKKELAMTQSELGDKVERFKYNSAEEDDEKDETTNSDSDSDTDSDSKTESTTTAVETDSDSENISLLQYKLKFNSKMSHTLFNVFVQPLRVQMNEFFTNNSNIKDAKFVLLSGGFANCAYIQNQITENIGQQYQMQLIKNPDLAAAFGACVYGKRPYKFAKYDSKVAEYPALPILSLPKSAAPSRPLPKYLKKKTSKKRIYSAAAAVIGDHSHSRSSSSITSSLFPLSATKSTKSSKGSSLSIKSTPLKRTPASTMSISSSAMMSRFASVLHGGGGSSGGSGHSRSKSSSSSGSTSCSMAATTTTSASAAHMLNVHNEQQLLLSQKQLESLNLQLVQKECTIKQLVSEKNSAVDAKNRWFEELQMEKKSHKQSRIEIRNIRVQSDDKLSSVYKELRRLSRGQTKILKKRIHAHSSSGSSSSSKTKSKKSKASKHSSSSSSSSTSSLPTPDAATKPIKSTPLKPAVIGDTAKTTDDIPPSVTDTAATTTTAATTATEATRSVTVTAATDVATTEPEADSRESKVDEGESGSRSETVTVVPSASAEIARLEKEISELKSRITGDLIECKTITNALVLIVCIAEYEGHCTGFKNLDGCVIDKERMIELFGGGGGSRLGDDRDEDAKVDATPTPMPAKSKAHQLKYEIICNKSNVVTKRDFDILLTESRYQFASNEDFDAIICIFSCHGTSDSIILSDGALFPRKQIFKFFNGDNCNASVDKMRLMIMDSCRGSETPTVIKEAIAAAAQHGHQAAIKTPKGGPASRYRYFHPDENTIIIYSNTDGYKSDDHNGGILISIIYETMRNAHNIKNRHLDDLIKIMHQKMQLKTHGLQCIEHIQKGNTRHIYFQAHNNGDDVEEETAGVDVD